jgi:hypothetical protein
LLILAPPEDVRPFVVDAACDPESRMRFDVLTKLPGETLPEADQSLLKQIRRLGASEDRSEQFELRQKTMLAGRFATKAFYQPMLVVYKQYSSKWDGDARGGMLAYLARYDEKGGLELLKQGIKSSTARSLELFRSIARISTNWKEWSDSKLETTIGEGELLIENLRAIPAPKFTIEETNIVLFQDENCTTPLPQPVGVRVNIRYSDGSNALRNSPNGLSFSTAIWNRVP